MGELDESGLYKNRVFERNIPVSDITAQHALKAFDQLMEQSLFVREQFPYYITNLLNPNEEVVFFLGEGGNKRRVLAIGYTDHTIDSDLHLTYITDTGSTRLEPPINEKVASVITPYTFKRE